MATPPNQMGLTGPVQPNDIVMRASEIGTTIPGIASLAMKSARKGAQRGVQGIYQLPSGNEPTPEFMNVSQQNLNNKTRQMADMLNMMAPEDEQLAYINEQEAGILKLLGGSGTTENNPAGIPSFIGAQGPGGMGAGGYGGSMSDSSGNSVGGGAGGGGGDNRERGMMASRAAAAAASAASAAANAAAAAAQRPNMADMTGGYDTPTGEVDGKSKGSMQDSRGNNIFSDSDIEVLDAGAAITGGGGYVTGGGGLVAAGGVLRDYRQGREDQKVRDDYAASQIAQAKQLAKAGTSRDRAYALSGLSDYNTSEGLQGLTTNKSLGNMEDRRNDLLGKAKENNISSAELDELGQLNKFSGDNPTQGMGFLESLEYNFTNQKFQDDLKKAGPLLGVAALGALAPGASLKGIYSIGKALMSITNTTPKSLKDTIQKALDKLTGGQKKALAKSLPSTYRGFGIQGEAQGNRGGSEKAMEQGLGATSTPVVTPPASGTGDEFDRAFAQRYFIGPTNLEEVRKYATEGGYNQLTPFSGREV